MNTFPKSFTRLLWQDFELRLNNWIPSFILFSFLVFFTPIALKAQYKFNQATLYTSEDGLPADFPRNMHKGVDGFLWCTTDNGVCRFDGTLFKVYQNDPKNPNSLLDNRTFALLTTPDKIWVGTALGVSGFEFKNRSVSKLSIGCQWSSGYHKA